jgi:hypothetical protein
MEETKNENTETLVKQEEQPSGALIKSKSTKILLELLVYGETKDKVKIKKFLDELQNQLTERKAKNRVRVLWYIDDGEKSIDEKKQWFAENINCKYFLYAHKDGKYHVEKHFVRETLLNIKKFEDSMAKLIASGVELNKNKPKSDEENKTELKIVK